MRWLRRKRTYDKRALAAEGEVLLSRERLADTRKNIVAPSRAAGRRNQFAQIIRASLINGYPKEKGG